MSSELEKSGIRVAVGDCSVTEHVHAKHYKNNENGRTAPGVCRNGSVPLSHSGNVVTRVGIHTHKQESSIGSVRVSEFEFNVSLTHRSNGDGMHNISV